MPNLFKCDSLFSVVFMSRLGKKPIIIPEGVEVAVEEGVVKVRGPKGELSLKLPPLIKIDSKDRSLSISAQDKSTQASANQGTAVALTKNAIEGVKEGFSKVLKLEGIGFRVSMEGKNLVLNVGFSHPVKFESPEGVAISVEKNIIKISGIDKALVGEAAARIRRIKKPEPYKGKGIRYEDEIVRRKAGKKAVGVTG